jgi:UDP-N-acetylmuramoyl-tripeptide--D-alanyl-D-alanine ligase
VRHWDAERIAAAAGGQVAAAGAAGPQRATIDSRDVRPGDLFVGIPGTRVDGGRFAAAAAEDGAWGVLVTPEWAEGIEGAAVITAEDPARALGRLARGWRRELAATVIAITGSVGKTSTKELTAAMLAPQRSVVASQANFNTEIGLPLAVLAAPAGTEILVLEMAMRGFGQITELAEIAEPDVGVVTNLAPVHLEQVGDLEGVARAKGELLVGMLDGGTAVVRAGETLLTPWLRPELETITFGPGGDVRWEGEEMVIPGGDRLRIELPVSAAHQRLNALAAAAACLAAGVRPEGRIDVSFGDLRGERVELAVGAVVINDCYNANPHSMRAALDDLATQQPDGGRRVAVLGDMLELGPAELDHHREIGAYAGTAGVDLLVAVGPRAAAMLDRYDGEAYAVADAAEAAGLVGEVAARGDLILVKGSRGVGLEAVAEKLRSA